MTNGIIKCDYLIIGAGIIGLTIAKELNERFSDKKIIIIEKENEVAMHSSGRNSGVLHAGFYYTSDSLKAKFTRDGSALMHNYCEKNSLAINYSKKVVITKDENELTTLLELHERAKANGVETYLIDEQELLKIEPNAVTYKKALFSPKTSTINPKEVCLHLKKELIDSGVTFHFNHQYKYKKETVVYTNANKFDAEFVINCAGLYADKIAKEYGFSEKYTILPFKGIYLKYTGEDKPISTNIYPVPNLNNPFLGVHYTITVDGTIKIGPTAIPALWRENYNGINNFDIKEMLSILKYETKLFITNAFNFRRLAFEELSKYYKPNFIRLATDMVKKIESQRFNEWSIPGIRAQLLETDTLKLVQDFVVEGDKNSLHVLNAVSPAFTASFAFSKWVVERYIVQK